MLNLMARTIHSIKEGSLTQRVLIFGGRVTDIIAKLGTPNEANVSVDLLRLM